MHFYTQIKTQFQAQWIRLICCVSFLSFLLINSASAADRWESPIYQDFDQWKMEFSSLADQANQTFTNVQVGALPLPEVDGQAFAIDYLYLPAALETKNLVILNSGIHGVEAPAGVHIQHDVLRKLLDDQTALSFNLEQTSVLMIHVMNPYGSAKLRRFDEANIDMNRNCFDAAQADAFGFPGLSIENPEYDSLSDFFVDKVSYIDLVIKAVNPGIPYFEKALSGQYQYPKGIYYGGVDVNPACRAVQGLMEEIILEHTNVAIFDIHTGLGSKGINQILVNPLPENATIEDQLAFDREVATLFTLFPDEECDELCEVQLPSEESFESTGDFTQWVYQRFPEKRRLGTVVSATAEIGTNGPIAIIETIINENVCTQYVEKCSEAELNARRQKLAAAFNLKQNRQWVNQVFAISEQMWLALSRFSQL